MGPRTRMLRSRFATPGRSGVLVGEKKEVEPSAVSRDVASAIDPERAPEAGQSMKVLAPDHARAVTLIDCPHSSVTRPSAKSSTCFTTVNPASV